MSTAKNPLENIEVRVMAAGGVDYLPEDTALHCKKVDLSCGSFGKKIAEMYQEIGTKDSLITTAPNPFAWGTFNVYPARTQLKTQCTQIVSNPNVYFETNLQHRLFNNYPTLNPSNKIHSDIYEGLLIQHTDYNKKCNSDLDYQNRLIAILKSIATIDVNFKSEIPYTPPFKDCPQAVKDAIATYICDKLLSVYKDPIHDGEYINTGYYGIAIGLGARFDLAKIETMIRELDPKRAGVPLDDINALKEYLRESRLYNELLKTNVYLALISTMNVMYNKSDLTRSPLYIDSKATLVKYCNYIAKNRDKLAYNNYVTFMREISELYTQVLEIVDRTEYISKAQENALLNTLQKII